MYEFFIGEGEASIPPLETKNLLASMEDIPGPDCGASKVKRSDFLANSADFSAFSGSGEINASAKDSGNFGCFNLLPFSSLTSVPCLIYKQGQGCSCTHTAHATSKKERAAVFKKLFSDRSLSDIGIDKHELAPLSCN